LGVPDGRAWTVNVPAHLEYPAGSSPIDSAGTDPHGYNTVSRHPHFAIWFPLRRGIRTQTADLAHRRIAGLRHPDGAQRQHHVPSQRGGARVPVAPSGIRGSGSAVGRSGGAPSGMVLEENGAVALLGYI